VRVTMGPSGIPDPTLFNVSLREPKDTDANSREYGVGFVLSGSNCN